MALFLLAVLFLLFFLKMCFEIIKFAFGIQCIKRGGRVRPFVPCVPRDLCAAL